MARGLGALFAGLGGGLTGYAQQEQRKRDEMERQRQREYAETLGLFQAGLEPAEQATTQATRMGTALEAAGRAAPAIPGMGGGIGAALQAASQMPSQDIQRGRRVTLGGREFVQPFSQTEEGREIAREGRREAAVARSTAAELTQVEEERARQRQEAKQMFLRAGFSERDADAYSAMPTAQAAQVLLNRRFRDTDDPMQDMRARLTMLQVPDENDPASRRFLRPDEINERLAVFSNRQAPSPTPATPSASMQDDADARAAWARQNPPRNGETREAYRARYEASRRR